jgi:hypothetical protein
MVTSLPIVVSADTGAIATITSNTDEVVRKTEITFDVSIVNCNNVNAMAITPVFNDKAFELVSGCWTVDGGIVSDFSTANGDGVIAFGAPAVIDGQVLSFTLRAVDNASLGQESVSVEIIINDDSGNHTVLSNNLSVEIKCDHDSASWKHGLNGHWKECSCGYKTQAEDHKWDDGTVTKEPTTTEKGEKTYKCTVCDFAKKEDIAMLEDNGDSPALIIVIIVALVAVICIALVLYKTKFAKKSPSTAESNPDKDSGSDNTGKNDSGTADCDTEFDNDESDSENNESDCDIEGDIDSPENDDDQAETESAPDEACEDLASEEPREESIFDENSSDDLLISDEDDADKSSDEDGDITFAEQTEEINEDTRLDECNGVDDSLSKGEAYEDEN